MLSTTLSNFNPVFTGASLVSSEAWSLLRDNLQLSDREIEIVQGLIEGQSHDCIAYTLFSSPQRVAMDIQRIYARLCVNSPEQLLVLVMTEYLQLVPGGNQQQPRVPSRPRSITKLPVPVNRSTAVAPAPGPSRMPALPLHCPARPAALAARPLE